MSYLKRSLQRL
jgi:hypothetical protein